MAWTHRSGLSPVRRPADDGTLNDDELLWSLKALAFIVSQPHGAACTPLFERFEAAWEERQGAKNARARARRLLDSYTIDGGFKAIR